MCQSDSDISITRDWIDDQMFERTKWAYRWFQCVSSLVARTLCRQPIQSKSNNNTDTTDGHSFSMEIIKWVFLLILIRSKMIYRWPKPWAMSFSNKVAHLPSRSTQTRRPMKVYWIMSATLHWCNGPSLSSTIWRAPFSKPWVRFSYVFILWFFLFLRVTQSDSHEHTELMSSWSGWSKKCVNWKWLSVGNDNPIECCTERLTDPSPRHRHPACMPLKVDVAAENYTVLPSCLNYVRSALGVNPDCKFGPAQQVSGIGIQSAAVVVWMLGANCGKNEWMYWICMRIRKSPHLESEYEIFDVRCS